MRNKRLRAAEMRGKLDRFEELPDEILTTIVSLLPLREALRTSFISKRWRFIWASHSDLKFDFVNVLGSRAHRFRNTCDFESKRQVQRRKFVNRVDKIMDERRIRGDKINSLAIHFHLGKNFSSHIDHWINSAVLKGVESIDIDLSECTSFRNGGATSNSFEHHQFRASPLEGKHNLRQLRLDSCTFSAPLSYKKLSLHLCQDLVNLKFTNSSHQLKFLDIKDCFRLNGIEVSSENLTRLEYTGHPSSFIFKQVPKLTDVYLKFTNKNRIDGVTYALTKLASEVTHLEKLNLISILSIKALELPDNGPVFTNVKELILAIYPFDDEDNLSWIAYILRAFPLLQRLQLNLFSPSFIKQPKEVDRLLPQCHHEHLTELEINGFYGNLHEAELLMYLLENVISLKRLMVGTNQKIFKGFENWVYEEANSFYKSRMKTTVSSWLNQIIPKTIHLEIR
ncbi:hypothetical protein CISIN_1g047944mg [Citrus sinensis]|uniref:F-box domain-containing protein n=1 Tax=Citrus sinensis TaxID=2711 RepID=A0A067EQF9_CITSI|nr:hypothetical protein CISIN_1g047944mg [Citrus sinensis]